MYLTYDDYFNLGGTEITDETAFEQLEFEARCIIDWWTFNRLQNEETYPEAVKRCMFKLISLLNDKQKAMVVDAVSQDGTVKAGVIHESNDGVATSYNTLSAKEAVEALGKATEDVIRMYLTGVRNSLGHKLLYRGLYPNE